MAPTTLFSSRPYTSILLLLWLVNSVSCSHNTVNKDASCALYPRGYQCLTRNAFIWCDNAANYTFDCPYGTSCDFLFSTSFPYVLLYFIVVCRWILTQNLAVLGRWYSLNRRLFPEDITVTLSSANCRIANVLLTNLHDLQPILLN